MHNHKTAHSDLERSIQECCPILELRQYNLQPGKRDTLIELFDREFVESQEALGMSILGQFRDLDQPDHFVWLRGFEDMASRMEGMTAFYGGPVWKKHREAANATMIDVDNVLLLHPAGPGLGFALAHARRAPVGETEIPNGLVLATVYHLHGSGEGFTGFFERSLQPLFMDCGASILASFVTEDSPNNFPALPVREGDQVFAWFALFQDEEAHEHYAACVSGSPEWRGRLSAALARRMRGKPEVLRLKPTARSLLHG